MSTAIASLADELLAIDDRPIEEVSIPEWGRSVHIRPITGRQRAAVEDMFGGDKWPRTAKATLVAYSVCDESGERVFGDDKIPELADKHGSAIERLFLASLKCSRLRESDIKDLERVFMIGQPNGSTTT